MSAVSISSGNDIESFGSGTQERFERYGRVQTLFEIVVATALLEEYASNHHFAMDGTAKTMMPCESRFDRWLPWMCLLSCCKRGRELRNGLCYALLLARRQTGKHWE